jgi:hypothetical protein
MARDATARGVRVASDVLSFDKRTARHEVHGFCRPQPGRPRAGGSPVRSVRPE